MRYQSDRPAEAATGMATAVAGGVLFALALLVGLFLVFGAALPGSALGGPGLLLSRSFSWAAWALPAWLGFAALLVFGTGFGPRRALVLGLSSLPFLALAAFARSVDPANPLFPGLDPGRSRAAALGFAALVALSTIALAWFASRGRALPEEAGEEIETEERLSEGILEEGSRSGLRAAEEPEGEEEAPPIAAGRVVEAEIPETSAAGFSLPVIPPPPPLRSLGLGRDQNPRPGAPSLPEGPGERPAEEPGPWEMEEFEPPAGAAAASARDLATAEAGPGAEDRGGAEAPIPLFFRGELGSPGPAEAPRPGVGSTALRPGTPTASEHPRVEAGPVQAAGAEFAHRAIEVVSVPPQPAAQLEAEEGRAAAFRRLLEGRKKPPYAVPVGELLLQYPDGEYWIVDDKTRRSAEILRETLAEFGIEAEVTGIRKGPVITMFEILPAPGVRLSKIANLADNIALRLAASSVRIVAPIPGKHAVGIEVPNERRSIVSLREIVESEVFVGAKAEVPVALGKDIAGEVQFIDLTQTPHLLIAGSTGSGKSVCVNSIILSILFRRSPEECRLMLIDPKIVELKLYNDVPHLLTPVITEPKRAFQALQYCICEMERRYAMLDRLGVRDIRSYNRKIKEKGLSQERLPYIVVIIDEFADLMATTGKELESTLARLAAMSRAVGIHLVLATQRPSIDVITGLIKANIPSRIAFMVASKFDSRIIIDMVGAEKLLGKGDMLFASAWDPFPIRMQGAFVSEEEVEKAVEYVKTLGEPEYIDEDIFIDDEEDEGEPNLFDDGDGDPLFEQALEIVLQQGKASASYIQRKLKIGYNRAARLVELMEEKGIVGKAQGSKPRDLVRNPAVAGIASASADAAGISRAALRELEEGGDEGDGGPLTVAGRAGGLPPIVGGLETVPGQRVTGRDED